jgi:hypothetical protein
MPTTMINREVIETILDTTSAGAVDGTVYALPPTKTGNRILTWESELDGGPSAVSLTIQGAIEEGGAFASLDTSTVAAGEVKVITTASALAYIKATQGERMNISEIAAKIEAKGNELESARATATKAENDLNTARANVGLLESAITGLRNELETELNKLTKNPNTIKVDGK